MDNNDYADSGLRICPLAKPTNTVAVPGDSEVTLSWDDPADTSITGYEYQQKEGDCSFGGWQSIAGSGATTTGHTVTGLINGTEYGFQLRALNDGGAGIATDLLTAAPEEMLYAQPRIEPNAKVYKISKSNSSDVDALAGTGVYGIDECTLGFSARITDERRKW